MGRKKVLPFILPQPLQRTSRVVEVGVGITDEGASSKSECRRDFIRCSEEAAVAASSNGSSKHGVNKMQPGGYLHLRVTFNFIIEEGAGRVELYDPEWNTPQDQADARRRPAQPHGVAVMGRGDERPLTRQATTGGRHRPQPTLTGHRLRTTGCTA
jgi:hypothetical protein